ncbi:39S ribosomal protein L21, mitochondrial [Chamberlinius hualienensis]
MLQNMNKLLNRSSLQWVSSMTKVGRPCVAYFQTTANNLALRRRPKTVKSYKDLPQPILRPIGPEDYKRWQYFLNRPKEVPNIEPFTSKDELITNNVISCVNEQIVNGSHGRLFAVVLATSKQFKVTTDDIIILQGYFEAELGAVIRLEKVLLVGSSDFTVIGRPLLDKKFAYVEATVIEKTLSQIITYFHMIPRKKHRRTNFFRIPYTMLRINRIAITDTIH